MSNPNHDCWHVAVGSMNPAKRRAVEEAFNKLGLSFHLDALDVASGVATQPKTDEETRRGAINRARAVCLESGADFGVGLEGGVMETEAGLLLCNFAAIVRQDGSLGLGGGVRVQLPEAVAEAVRAGRELGDVIDEWAGQKDIRTGDGTIGILTGGLITRSQMFSDAILCAMSRFLTQSQVYE